MYNNQKPVRTQYPKITYLDYSIVYTKVES